MKRLWKWTKRALLGVLLAAIGLISPVIYVETMCQGSGTPVAYAALLPPEDHRPETRTLMTFPEWHIVHAYEDYAKVISTNAPHDFGYLQSIGGFWSSLCSLTTVAADHGEIDSPTKQMVYVIGVSFTAELLLKAAYEETIGRLVVMQHGEGRTAADDLSASQAQAYATFLQQVPWYKWRFREDAADLARLPSASFRDSERKVALGLEYGAKARYADVIAQAVASTGFDALTLRMVLAPKDSPPALPEGVTMVKAIPQGLVIETPRYRALTYILQDLAASGFDFVEIAGNDDILFSLLSADPIHQGALYSEPRQGFGDYRHLVVVKVSQLAQTLREADQQGAVVEHIHDY